jgi:hypothetical protein
MVDLGSRNFFYTFVPRMRQFPDKTPAKPDHVQQNNLNRDPLRRGGRHKDYLLITLRQVINTDPVLLEHGLDLAPARIVAGRDVAGVGIA